MRLLIYNLPTSHQLLQEFEALGLGHGSADGSSSPSTSPLETKDALLVLVHLRSESDLPALNEARTRHPDARLIAHIDDDAAEIDTLVSHIAASACDDFWTGSNWRTLLLFSASRAVARTLRSQNDRKLIDSTTSVLDRLERSVELASEIHRTLIPSRFPSPTGLRVVAKFIPSAGSGGNYFDILEFEDGKRVGILLADFPTHSSAAALLTALMTLTRADLSGRFAEPRDLVEYLLQQIEEEASELEKNKSQLRPALIYAIVDRTDLSLRVARLGDLPCLFRSREGFQSLIAETSNEIQTFSRQLVPNDWLIFATTGWRSVFGRKDLGAALDKASSNYLQPSPEHLQQDLLGAVDRAKAKNPLKSDLTVVQLAIEPQLLYVASAQSK